MTLTERIVADYAGTGLTVGPHPMAFRREELALRGVLRAIDLRRARNGRRVRVAGAVITRQRPGTAKGFVFLTLEDETGIANVIIQPDLYTTQRMAIVEEPFLLVEGLLQIKDGVTSVKADRLQGLQGWWPTSSPATSIRWKGLDRVFEAPVHRDVQEGQPTDATLAEAALPPSSHLVEPEVLPCEQRLVEEAHER